MRETLVKGSVSPKVRGSVVCLPVPAILYLKKQKQNKTTNKHKAARKGELVLGSLWYLVGSVGDAGIFMFASFC